MFEQLSILLEIAVAMVLGGAVGVERELADKPAGFRTHMLVAGVSALLVGLSDTLIDRFGGGEDQLRADPIRVVEAIVTGVSILGAGTIFMRRDRTAVAGLTTAASILLSAGIGISVALRQYWLAVGVTVLALLVLRGCKFVQGWIDRPRN